MICCFSMSILPSMCPNCPSPHSSLWKNDYSRILFLVLGTCPFCFHFFQIIPRCLHAPSMEFSTFFYRTTFLMSQVFSSHIGKLSKPHIHNSSTLFSFANEIFPVLSICSVFGRYHLLFQWAFRIWCQMVHLLSYLKILSKYFDI